MTMQRRTRAYVLAVVTTGLLVVGPSMPAGACGPESPNGAIHGVLLDATTGQPVQDTYVVVVTEPVEDTRSLDGLAEPGVPEFLAAQVAKTNAKGEFQTGVYLMSPLEVMGWSMTCCAMPQPVGPPRLDQVFAYVRVASQWRPLEIPLGADNRGKVEGGIQSFTLPTIYVTADGLNLTKG